MLRDKIRITLKISRRFLVMRFSPSYNNIMKDYFEEQRELFQWALGNLSLDEVGYFKKHHDYYTKASKKGKSMLRIPPNFTNKKIIEAFRSVSVKDQIRFYQWELNNEKITRQRLINEGFSDCVEIWDEFIECTSKILENLYKLNQS